MKKLLIHLGLIFLPTLPYLDSSAEASVLVNLKSGNMQASNDGDDGLYINNGDSSQRKQQSDIFKNPVGDDKKPRWPTCEATPCSLEPTPSTPPGPEGLKAIRKLTKPELEYYEQVFKKVTLSASEQNLKNAMAQSASRLEYVSVQGIGEAMQPTRDALSLADNSSGFYAQNARKALDLSIMWAETRRFMIQAEVSTDKAWGTILVPCEQTNNLIKAFNQAAGSIAVNYGFKKGAFGINTCKYPGSIIESAMLSHVRKILLDEPADPANVGTWSFGAGETLNNQPTIQPGERKACFEGKRQHWDKEMCAKYPDLGSRSGCCDNH